VAEWIDGKALAQEIRAEVALEIARLRSSGVRPGLAVVIVGDDPASHVYARSKVRECQALGIHSEKIELPGDCTTERLLEAIDSANAREEVHGVLVQVPLPPQVDARRVLHAIRPEKDVDGLHPYNIGQLVAGRALLRPCTPAGIVEIFKRRRIPLVGSRAVVIGWSDIVGKPLSFLLLHEHATVTVCHSGTRDLPDVCRQADVLVAAMGRPGFVDETFVKPGAVVIDAGMNRVDSVAAIRSIFGEDDRRLAEHAQKGYTLVGDVHPVRAFPKCSYMTPVPGGIGPLTIAMLMSNTVRAAARAAGASRTEAFTQGAMR